MDEMLTNIRKKGAINLNQSDFVFLQSFDRPKDIFYQSKLPFPSF